MANPNLDHLYNFSLLVLLTYRYIIYTIRLSHAERAAGIVAIIPLKIASYILDAAGEIQMVDNKKIYVSLAENKRGHKAKCLAPNIL